MYEKRRYGDVIRYRVTEAMSASKAKKAAAAIRDKGLGCQIDTYKGGFAVWSDKKVGTARKSGHMIRKSVSKLGSSGLVPATNKQLHPTEYAQIHLLHKPSFHSSQFRGVRLTVDSLEVFDLPVRKLGTIQDMYKSAVPMARNGKESIIVSLADGYALVAKPSDRKSKEYDHMRRSPQDMATQRAYGKVIGPRYCLTCGNKGSVKRTGRVKEVGSKRGYAPYCFTCNKFLTSANSTFRKSDVISRPEMRAVVARDLKPGMILATPATFRATHSREELGIKTANHPIPNINMMEAFFVNQEGTSNKFWGYRLSGDKTVTVYWGRIGAKMYSYQTKKLPNISDWAVKMELEKLAKGYVEIRHPSTMYEM